MRKAILVKALVVVLAGLFLLLAPAAWAQPCEADINCDKKVGLPDLIIIKGKLGNNYDPCPPAPMSHTGQTTSYAKGDDGDLKNGFAWPNPRFTDNRDGTITDKLTGLIWLKDANCFGKITWAKAISRCKGLADGSCGLTDGSHTGDWRLPNYKELLSLIDVEYYNPALPNTAGTGHWSEGNPFINVQPGAYWLSTTYAYNNLHAWGVRINLGILSSDDKSRRYFAWPVRGGQ